MRFPTLFVVLFAITSLHAETITVTIDAARDRHPINPAIYGVAFATAEQLRELNVPLNRWGGNTTTRYNWQLNAANHGQDYFFESISEEGDALGAAADAFIADARAGGAQPLITIPMIEWVARLGSNRDKLASFSIAKYGPQQQSDPFMPDAGNGIRPDGTPITGNDPRDANVQVDSSFQQAWLQHLISRWGAAAAGGVRLLRTRQ